MVKNILFVIFGCVIEILNLQIINFTAQKIVKNKNINFLFISFLLRFIIIGIVFFMILKYFKLLQLIFFMIGLTLIKFILLIFFKKRRK